MEKLMLLCVVSRVSFLIRLMSWCAIWNCTIRMYCLFIVFKLLGFYTQAKYHTSEGRIDLVVKTDKYIYVMEFKLNGTAEEALKQINDKHYALPFASARTQSGIILSPLSVSSCSFMPSWMFSSISCA